MGFWDAIGAFGHWVEEHLKDILNIIGKVLQTLVVTFRALTGVLANVLKGHFSIFTSAARWVAHAMSTLVKKWIPGLIQEVRSLYTKLRNLAKPIIDAIHRIRQIQQLYFDTYIRPILNFIQHLRQALLILRLLHVKWATALDQRLADIENKLTARFMEVLRALNLVSNYLNYILDPFGLFDSGLYLQTALRSIGALFAALHQAQMGFFGAADQADASHWSNFFHRSQADARTKTMLSGGQVPEYTQITANIHGVMKELGAEVPPWEAT